VVDRVVEDVVERVVVLLFGFDHFRPEPLAEDVVLAAVAFVEGTSVLAVEIAHAVREVREWCLDDQVVVVAEQAAGVQPPAVGSPDALQDLEEDRSIPVVEEDRRVVVSLRPDVVVGAGREIPVRSAHSLDGNGATAAETTRGESRRRSVTDRLRARQVTGLRERVAAAKRRDAGPAGYAATLERSRCWCDGQ
jgi:hypothetical protein